MVLTAEFYRIQKSGWEEVVLTRLHISHSRLKHSCLFKQEDKPLCICCNEPFMVKHTLIDYIEFSHVWASLTLSSQMPLNNSCPKIRNKSISLPVDVCNLTFTTLWAFSADDRLMIFFLFFPENRIWHFMQIVSVGDNLHEMSNPVFWEK